MAPWAPSTLPTVVVFDTQWTASVLPNAQRWMWGVIPPTGLIKVWDGTQWVKKPVKVWTGTDWVAYPMKFWNGYGYRRTQ